MIALIAKNDQGIQFPRPFFLISGIHQFLTRLMISFVASINATAVKASPVAIPKCTKPKSAGIEKMPRTAGNKVAAYNVLQKATA